MKYYAVSDVHGYYTQLMVALETAGFLAELSDKNSDSKLVMCGDLLDRGGEARQLIDLMLRLKNEGRLIYIRGNHEDLLVQCLQQIDRGGVFEIAGGMSCHYGNGTWDTLLQISGMSEIEAYNDPKGLVGGVMQSPFYSELLPSSVDFHETPHYIFTHGWIPCIVEGYGQYTTYEFDPDWRCADTVRWSKARWFNGMKLACEHNIIEPNKTTVCGHWHASYGHHFIEGVGSEFDENADFSPFSAAGVLAIDAATPISGMVNCVVIED